MPFRLSGKRFLLTYAHTDDFSPVELFNFLNEKKAIKRYLGVVELHEYNPDDPHHDEDTEWPHVHASVWFADKLNTTNARYFDLQNIHPNIKPILTDAMWVDSCKYLLKSPIELHKSPDDWDLSTHHDDDPDTVENIWEVLDSCGDCRKTWTSYCHKKKIPFAREDFMWKFIHNSAADTSTVTVRKTNYPEKDPPTPEAAEARRILWEETDIPNPDTDIDPEQSLVIVGPSGSGKSVWVEQWAPLPYLFCNHIDAIRYFRAGYHKCIIFDDARFAHNPINNQIQLLDRARVQHVHMRNIFATLPKGLLKIFTCANYVPFVDDTQIKRRMHLIWLHPGEPIYATKDAAMTFFV